MTARPIVDAGSNPISSHSDEELDGATLYQIWTDLPERVAYLASKRAEAEARTKSDFEARLRRAETNRRDALTAAELRREAESGELATLIATRKKAAITEYASTTQAAEAERDTTRKNAIMRYRRTLEEAKKTHEAARWEAGTMLEAADKGAREWTKETSSHRANEAHAIEVLKGETESLKATYRGFLAKPVANSTPVEISTAPATEDPFPRLRSVIERADAAVLSLEALKLPQAFHGARIAWVFVLPALVLAYPAWLFLGNIAGPIVALVIAGIMGFLVRGWIVKKARESIHQVLIPLESDLAEATGLVDVAGRYIKDTAQQRIKVATEKRDREWNLAQTQFESVTQAAEIARDEKVRQVEADTEVRLKDAQSRHDALMKEIEQTEAARTKEIAAGHVSEQASAQLSYKTAITECSARHERDWNALAADWSIGSRKVVEDAELIRGQMDSRFPSWDKTTSWKPQPGMPWAIRFGELDLDLAKVPSGISADDKLRVMAPTLLKVPAIAAFPEKASLAYEFATDVGRQATIEAMQGAVLRFLTGLPAGKVRLTMLDPVGLGRSFAGFMHLADFSEALVNNRIWTEPQQIDARLSELNSHIELVIQNYLRNEFASIEVYNEQAAEVAEPYRILVVPDFPAGFNESTARRLAAIAKSGPRCGVYVVLGLDSSQPFPPNVPREDLLTHFVRLFWREDRFRLRNPAWEKFTFHVDTPPPGEQLTRLLHQIGEAAHAANRVEVPFEVIAPKPEDYWKGDSRSEVVVPLGRSGATKLQSLRLGRGTSQHVLIAGRTGSGKSTLLHALITNAALIYSPEEIELYLIDFKKGVEFKTYATHKLPHARVVAIESEREFGLSVLQRLDAELKARGDLYRDLGVQDVAGFRAIAPDRPMPRILLVVDEFQEFFIEDDKLAQECSLLLDRLVRQGRAFGVHVHLGSQTLGGAYSLARSTLGQMAIRIALQCSEADAHLILNEDNSAARLLSRPGEAIYNDANGQTEGNHTFQVVWLPDARREAYLKSLSELAKTRGIETAPPIVFEGNKPADLKTLAILNQPRQPKTGTVYVWLGDAVAIKDPTAAPFRAQGGKNLLILGQNAEMAAGLVHAAIVGLSAQVADEGRIYVLDGTPDDSPFAGVFKRSLAGLPQSTRWGEAREAGAILSELAAEVERRQSTAGETVPWFLFVYDLPRIRDLRKVDDDFSFSSRRGGEEKPVNPGKLFSTLLRDGPSVGVHLIVWCDSLNNANRAFDRQTMREFEMRVLFQMSPADSSNLIDSPAASRLGAHRAFFSSEEEGKLEKFRPYGLPGVTSTQ